MTDQDHPIFVESIRYIKNKLGFTGLEPLQQDVLERLIHSSGDFQIVSMLSFSLDSCHKGLAALKAGAPILTDTAMAATAVKPMALRTLQTPVRNVLEWAPIQAPNGYTRSAIGMKRAWLEMSSLFEHQRSPIVLIGSAPSALETLLDLVENGSPPPSLIIGMPVGFVGVLQSKSRLVKSGLANICLEGSRGGAGLAAAVVNALLRAANLSE